MNSNSNSNTTQFNGIFHWIELNEWIFENRWNRRVFLYIQIGAIRRVLLLDVLQFWEFPIERHRGPVHSHWYSHLQLIFAYELYVIAWKSIKSISLNVWDGQRCKGGVSSPTFHGFIFHPFFISQFLFNCISFAASSSSSSSSSSSVAAITAAATTLSYLSLFTGATQLLVHIVPSHSSPSIHSSPFIAIHRCLHYTVRLTMDFGEFVKSWEISNYSWLQRRHYIKKLNHQQCRVKWAASLRCGRRRIGRGTCREVICKEEGWQRGHLQGEWTKRVENEHVQ